MVQADPPGALIDWVEKDVNPMYQSRSNQTLKHHFKPPSIETEKS
jgi:hypothetical protein